MLSCAIGALLDFVYKTKFKDKIIKIFKLTTKRTLNCKAILSERLYSCPGPAAEMPFGGLAQGKQESLGKESHSQGWRVD